MAMTVGAGSAAASSVGSRARAARAGLRRMAGQAARRRMAMRRGQRRCGGSGAGELEGARQGDSSSHNERRVAMARLSIVVSEIYCALGQGGMMNDQNRLLGGLTIAAVLIGIALLSAAAGVPWNGWRRIHSYTGN